MSDRCELSDLPEEMCACRIHGPKEEKETASRPFVAAFPGECPECEEDIRVGDVIQWNKGKYIHQRCMS